MKRLPTDLTSDLQGAIAAARAFAVHHFLISLDEAAMWRRVEASRAHHAGGGGPRPLEGVLVAIKDQFDVEGALTTCGTTFCPGRAAADAEAVARLRAAGALIFGKANMHELALGPTGQVVTLVSLLAGLALVLGAVGVYGVISHFVVRRSRDFGIRLALGQQPLLVIRQVVGRGVGLVALGAAVGLGAAFGVSRLLASLLYGVRPNDPLALGGAVAVLYYGSTLRTTALEGMLDFYVLLDRTSAWPGSRLAALANRLLPPNVGYVEGVFGGVALRAKFALVSMAQFEARVAGRSIDTTMWARFCQPCRCAWQRSAADQQRVVAAVRDATLTAASWAAALGPAQGTPQDYWAALFARTYVAELRVETGDRSQGIVAADGERYGALLPLAWDVAGIHYESLADGTLHPELDGRSRRRQAQQWARRQRWGKPLNILRLCKAAFTFDGGADYVVWKIERHRGVRLELSPWQRRFPLLAAPGIYWQLRRRGIIR